MRHWSLVEFSGSDTEDTLGKKKEEEKKKASNLIMKLKLLKAYLG